MPAVAPPHPLRDLVALIASVRSGPCPGCVIPGPNPGAPSPAVYHLTLEDAKQRALATSKGLGLANLGIGEKGEATAAARTDYLPKLLGNVTYLHFNSNLGTSNTVRTGRLGILPPGSRTIAVTAVNQDSSLCRHHARPTDHEADRRQRGGQDRQGRRADRPGTARQRDPRPPLRRRPGVLRPARGPAASRPPCAFRWATPSSSPRRTARPRSAWRRSRRSRR